MRLVQHKIREPEPDHRADRDDWDNHWKEYADSAAINPAQEYRRRLILRILAAGDPIERFVDLGAGTGELIAEVQAAYPEARIVGVELSAEGTELARRRVPGATFYQLDLLTQKPPSELRGSATHAVCSEVLEHIEQPERLLANASRYLAPGCRIIVTVPGGPMSAFDRYIGHRSHYRPSELRALLDRCGYNVEIATGAGFPFFNIYRLAVLFRGKRLIDDASAAGQSLPTRLAMRTFRLLFRLTLTSSRWGWQTIAVARVGDRSHLKR